MEIKQFIKQLLLHRELLTDYKNYNKKINITTQIVKTTIHLIIFYI